MSNKEMYEVLEHDKYKGLTVGKVLSPGQKFEKKQWPYGDKALAAAVKNKRCKVVVLSKKEVSSNKDEEKLTNMKKAYMAMDPEHKNAKKLLEKIQELEK